MKKLIKILIVVIIPLLAAFGIGTYAYRRYQGNFFPNYMDNASQDSSIERFVTLLEFEEQYLDYKKTDDGFEFFYSKDVENEYGKLFHLDIIRSNRITKEDETKDNLPAGQKDVNDLTYFFAIYNLNYKTVATSLEDQEDGEHGLLKTEIPALQLQLVDTKDENIVTTVKTLGSVLTDYANAEIPDYGYSPKKDDRGRALFESGTSPMFYMKLDASALNSFSEKVKVVISAASSWTGADTVTKEVFSEEIDGMYNGNDINKKDEAKDELKKFTKVYDQNIKEAGYFSFCFKKYIWWEALLAIAVAGIVCGSFVAVWSSEEKESNKKDKNKLKK